jgi:hypothetical protein
MIMATWRGRLARSRGIKDSDKADLDIRRT